MSSFIEIDTGTYSEQANAPMVTGLSKTYALHVKRMMVQCKRSEEIRELTKKKVSGTLSEARRGWGNVI